MSESEEYKQHISTYKYARTFRKSNKLIDYNNINTMNKVVCAAVVN